MAEGVGFDRLTSTPVSVAANPIGVT